MPQPLLPTSGCPLPSPASPGLGPVAPLPNRFWLVLSCLALAFSPPSIVLAQLRDSFEGPQPTWRLAEADCGVKLVTQQRTYRDSHSGNGCEHLRLNIGNGTFVHLTLPIGKAPLIAELEPKLWIKSDKPHLQIMARVVLPRTIEDATGKPITTLLRGDTYTDVNNWQQLSVREVAKSLARQVVALRTQFGKEVDGREAYLDMLVLNVYSAPGNIDLLVDDLEISGYVNLDEEEQNAQSRRPLVADGSSPASPSSLNSAAAPAPLAPTLQGPLLLVDGRPLLPRVIEQNGEPLEWLASLGFNTVQLPRPPSAKDLKEAERLSIWLVAPPPPLEEGIPLGSQYSRVLAWNMGSRLTSRDLQSTQKLSSDLRRADPNRARPIVCTADSDLANYSRLGGIVNLSRPSLATSFELADFRYWLLQRQRLMRPGTPTWSTIPTHLPDSLHEQLLLFSQGQRVAEDGDWHQLQQLIYSSLAAGSRGFLFTSHLSLNTDSNAAALRTDTFKLLNHELRVLEPWAAGGTLMEDSVIGKTGTHVSMLQTERSRLLLVLRTGPAAQYVTPPSGRPASSLVVPGVPISDRAYQVTLSGLKQLRTAQGNGGIRIMLDELGPATAIVVTQDPLVLHHLNRTLAETASETARLRFEIATRRLINVVEIDRDVTQAGHPLATAQASIQEAQTHLDQARRLLETGDLRGLHDACGRAEQLTARLARGHWEQTASAFPAPAASPCIMQFSTLPLHWKFAERIQRGGWGPNALGAGNMEDLRELLSAGWKQQRPTLDGVSTNVSLSLLAPHSGRSALRMQAVAAQADRQPQMFEREVVSITSAPVPVGQGQVARIHGFVYVPRPLEGTAEGLLIYDSFSGTDLGQRVKYTQGWREFTLYRGIPRNGELAVTFALTGLGEAWVDDVSISLMNADPIRETSLPTDRR